MNPTGFNPIRHECDRDGCYNKKYRIGIEFLCDLFPGKISMTDVDLPNPGMVEINGFFLILEHKSPGAVMTLGQRIAASRFSRQQREGGIVGNMWLVFEGHAPSLDVKTFRVFWCGRLGKERAGDSAFRDVITRWVAWAKAQPPLARFDDDEDV